MAGSFLAFEVPEDQLLDGCDKTCDTCSDTTSLLPSPSLPPSLPLSPLTRHSHNVTLEFQSVSQDAILLFAQSSPSTDHFQDFLALELLNGRLTYSYNLGGGRAEVTTSASYSDGYLHVVSGTCRDAGIFHGVTFSWCSLIVNFTTQKINTFTRNRVSCHP